MYKKVDTGQDFQKMELSILEFWDKERCFEQLVEKNSNGPVWSFIDGPITANNPMGMHHAWGRTLKDAFQRYRAMKGFKQRFQNGFDCQGLHVEVETEKELGFTSKKDIEEYGLDNFALKCRERVQRFADLQTKQSIRLGQWMHWDKSYYTMADENIEHIWFFIKECHEKGWLYKDLKPLPWCARCGTSLSQHELADNYKDTKDTAIFVRFKLLDAENEYLLLWTTTPWTLTSNVAAAVNPDLQYVKAEKDGDIYYLADVAVHILGKDVRILERINGKNLINRKYEGPFDDLPAQKDVEHPVIAWEGVGAEEGSGIVHIAPGCGAEDFELGKEHGLAVIVPIDDSGIYVKGFDWLEGEDVLQVGDKILADLKKKNLLLNRHEYEHRYPFCWRCKQPLVFRVEEEWFINCDEIRQPMKEAANKVEWMPESVGKRVQDWYNNMGDWCISRKRYWGLPLPFYYCENGHLTIIGTKKELLEKAIDREKADNLQELHRPWIDEITVRCDECGKPAARIPEVGDCWLDAGIVPFSTLRYLDDRSYWETWFPTEFICEMREQVRLWFYSLMFMSVTIKNVPPYLKVLSYEKLLDGEGRPMHKSLGNAIWFDDAVEKMGADVMRWLYCAHNPAVNLRFGYAQADETRRKLLTLWNVYSFFVTYAEIDRFDPSDNGEKEVECTLLDRWILSAMNSTVEAVGKALDSYDTVHSMTAIEGFINNLSNWYIRRSRRRFWKSGNDADKNAAYTTLHECLDTLIRVLAPFCPFIAEEIYQNLVLPAKERGLESPASVHLTDFPKPDHQKMDPQLEKEMELILKVVTLARSARQQAGIKVRQPLGKLNVVTDEETDDIPGELLSQVLEEINIKQIEFRKERSEFSCRELKLDFSVLGRKYGKQVQTIAKAVKTGDFEDTADGGVMAAGIKLQPDEFTVHLKGTEPFSVAYDRNILVALDTSITGELRKEGIGREIIRYIQELRKTANLEVSEKIHAYFACDLDEHAAIFSELDEHIRSETLSESISNHRPDEVLVDRELKLEKHRIWLGIEKIG